MTIDKLRETINKELKDYININNKDNQKLEYVHILEYLLYSLNFISNENDFSIYKNIILKK